MVNATLVIRLRGNISTLHIIINVVVTLFNLEISRGSLINHFLGLSSVLLQFLSKWIDIHFTFIRKFLRKEMMRAFFGAIQGLIVKWITWLQGNLSVKKISHQRKFLLLPLCFKSIDMRLFQLILPRANVFRIVASEVLGEMPWRGFRWILIRCGTNFMRYRRSATRIITYITNLMMH